MKGSAEARAVTRATTSGHASDDERSRERPVCEARGCPAAADGEDGWCPVHRVAKCVQTVMVGQKCARCGRPLEPGDYVTRESTMVEMTHAACPPKRPYLGRIKDRVKPLLELLGGS